MKTAVVIEHDMDVVFHYSDRIVMMHEGSFLADGTPDEIRANKDINTYRGPAHILRGVSISVDTDEVVALVGRNGAGRTTIIESVTGLLPVRSGQIRFRDEEITSLPPHRRARRGIGYAPENSGIFPELTVAENMMISRWLSAKTGRGAATGGDGDTEAGAFRVFPEVRPLLSRQGLNLSGGQKKMVAIARAMALASYLLILDE